ncbi:MAG TPA: HDOD domain-containing protein [Kofleriaceae bacterium]|nr:HDOD domain-containing protein [Kofleriaceae bacterium]
MTAPLDAFVGRQAIFDRRLEVVGYELLFRNSEENRARFSDANQATATTMLNAFVEMGLDSLVGGLPVWVNLPADFLLGRYPLPMPPERTVIEVLEDVPVTPALITSLESFAAEGFKIALDDFVLTDETRALVPLATYLKVDVLNVANDEIKRQYDALHDFGPMLLAEKISTHDEHIFLRDLGFYLFQGHFLELPIVSKTKRLPHDRVALVKILNALYKDQLDLRELDALIAGEVGLSVRLIKLASSAAMSMGQPIGSVRQAVLRLGVQQVGALVMLIMVAGFDDKPLDLARQALIRARMAEGLARQAHLPSDQLFTAGLLSLLDAILDRPLAAVLKELAIAPLIRQALAGGGSPAAKILDTVRHQNRGDLTNVRDSGFSANQVFVAWFDAIRWTQEIMAKIE